MSSAADLVRILQDQRDTGAIGVALGRKEVAGHTSADSEPSLAFIVERKEARRGRARTVASGARVVPRRLELGDSELVTDVVEAAAKPIASTARMQRTRFSAGGPLGNRTELGTFGCVVRREGARYRYALTNQHVALAVGSTCWFPAPGSPGALAAPTRASVDLIPDEIFSPFLDSPNAYFDVDAALVQIPENARDQFSPDIPTLGVPDGVFRPDTTSLASYQASTIGRPVATWSWSSGRREAAITHVLYTTRLQRFNAIGIYSFLIRSADSNPPGVSRDSGKAWVSTRPGGGLDLVGLHLGVVPVPGGASLFAVATEAAALFDHFGIAPAADL
jgi:hypothetical protein